MDFDFYETSFTFPSIGIIKEQLSFIIDDIVERKHVTGITYYQSQTSHRVFSVDNFKTIVFKVDTNNDLVTRLNNIRYCQEICKKYKLSFIIPMIEVCKIGKYEVLVEEKLNVVEDYKLDDNAINEVVKQLTLFIYYSKFKDVENRNLPICELNGKYKIGLIDLEDCTSGYTGLFGGFKNITGLQFLFSIDVKDIILETLKTIGIDTSKNVKMIEFSKYPKSNDTLKKFTMDLLYEIELKKQIDKGGTFFVQTNHGIFYKICALNKDTTLDPFEYISDKEYNTSTMIYIIIDKLNELGYDVKIDYVNGHGAFLLV